MLFGYAGLSHRLIVIAASEGAPSIESSADSGLSSQDREQALLLTARLRECETLLSREAACEGWSIEGFWRPEGARLLLLQLRPTPKDRPQPDGVTAPPQLRGDDFTTRFVWGRFHRSAVVRGGELAGDRILSLCSAGRRRDWRTGYDSGTLAGIAAGRVDLVVRSDPAGASRISHEPWFLPPPEYRHGFCHAWIPKAALERLEGSEVTLASDGDRLCCSLEQGAAPVVADGCR